MAKVVSALLSEPLTGRPSVTRALTVPLLELGSIRVPENSLRRSEARISAIAGTGPSIRNRIFAGDGFGAMSGTSKTKSVMFSLRPGRRIGRSLPDGDGRGAAGHPGLQIGVAYQRHFVHRPQGHA